jgi:hypothetical protein
MTVRAIIPIERYTGNGVITDFAWDWDMIIDSSINVQVDNVNVTNWTLNGQTVVFDTAPADGAEIVIYRRTKLWMPEDYKAFGWFNADKTELSMDRAMLIKQERYGDALPGEPPNGIVGGSDLSVTLAEFDLTVVSERGTDAVLPIYAYDDTLPPTPGNPDPTIIIWEGNQINAGRFDTVANSAVFRFRTDLTGGDPAEASAFYPNYNDDVYVSWCTVDPADDEYWMRVLSNTSLPTSRYDIWDGGAYRGLNEAFQIVGDANAGLGPYVSVDTFGDTPGTTRSGLFTIEICKDDGGLPDGEWASRAVKIESIFNGTDPNPPPDTEGSVSWESYFGQPFSLNTFFGNITKQIPAEGLSIRFTIPITTSAYRLFISTLEVSFNPTLRFGAINQTVLDFDTPPTHTWGLGGGIDGGINLGGQDIDLIPGETYFFNIKTENLITGFLNQVTIQASTLAP